MLILTHFTDRNLFIMKNYITDDGKIDKLQFTYNIKEHNTWPESFNIDDLYDYFADRVVLANDFATMNENNLRELPQISRIIMKSTYP